MDEHKIIISRHGICLRTNEKKTKQSSIPPAVRLCDKFECDLLWQLIQHLFVFGLRTFGAIRIGRLLIKFCFSFLAAQNPIFLLFIRARARVTIYINNE